MAVCNLEMKGDFGAPGLDVKIYLKSTHALHTWDGGCSVHPDQRVLMETPSVTVGTQEGPGREPLAAELREMA